MLYPCLHTCKPASTQSSFVVWKNFVTFSCRKRFFFVIAFSDIALEQLLVRFADFDWLVGRTML